MSYIKQIKKNVWKWENENGLFSVKKYSTMEQAEKIRLIHLELERLDMQFVLPIIESSQLDFIIQPWFSGTHTVNYEEELDRKETYSLLSSLHETNNQIKWEKHKLLRPFDLIEKWKNRLIKMQEISYFVEFYIGYEQTKKLLEYGEIALLNMSVFDRSKPTLLHGDVVHHNFLSNEEAYKMIDFDLAVVGPKEMEEILWMHRVLPAIDYNFTRLLSEFPDLEEVVQMHKSAFIFPNELYREWLYAFSLPLERKQKFMEQLIPYTNKALSEWPNVCYSISQL